MSEMQNEVHGSGERASPGGSSAKTGVDDLQRHLKPADPEFSAWCAFARDSQKKGAEVCRAAASTLVAITAVLFAGYIAFMRVSIVDVNAVARATLLSPLIAWAIAGGALVWFILPHEWSAVPAAGNEVQREFNAFVKRRTRWLRGIGGVILTGVVTAIYVFAKIV